MRKIIRSTIAGLLVLAAQGAFAKKHAATEAQVARFVKWLDILEEPLKTTNSKTVAAQRLIELEKARYAAFQLQALGRIYKDYDEEFEKFLKRSQEIEDALGEVDKWDTLKIPTKLAGAKKALADILEEGEWYGNGASPRIQKLRNSLDRIDWSSEEKDKEFVLEQITEQLKYVKNTDFDMSKLQKSLGLHAFRRALRWFGLEAQSTDGLIAFKRNNTCPIAEFAPLMKEKVADSKYSRLEENPKLEVKACRISRCLFVAVADLVKKLGDIKDEGEVIEEKTGSDKVPPALLKRAQEQYARVTRTNLLGVLKEEIKACEN